MNLTSDNPLKAKFACKSSPKLESICSFCYSCHKNKHCKESTSCHQLLKIPFCCTNVLSHGDTGLGFQQSGCFDYEENIDILENQETNDGSFEREVQNVTIGILTQRIKNEDNLQADCDEPRESMINVTILLIVIIIVFVLLVGIVIYLRFKER